MSKYSGPWRYWMALDKNDKVVAYTSDHKLFKLFKKQRRHDLYSFYSFDLESEEVHFLADKLHLANSDNPLLEPSDSNS